MILIQVEQFLLPPSDDYDVNKDGLYQMLDSDPRYAEAIERERNK